MTEGAVALSRPPATAPADQRIAAWIEQLGADDADGQTAARKELLVHGSAALDALLRARTGSDPRRTAAVEEVLNILRVRICLRAAREAIRREIQHQEKEIAGYETAATQPVNQMNQKDIDQYRQLIERERTKLAKIQEEAARYAKMTDAEYVLPAPVHLEVTQGDRSPNVGPASPPWAPWNGDAGLTAWKPGAGDSWLMYYVGMSRSGAFYRALVAATPMPARPRLAVAAYPLFRTTYPFPEYYVYIERRDYPVYASTAQRVDDLLATSERLDEWGRKDVAEELATLARTDPSARPLLRQRALPVLRKALEQEGKVSGATPQPAVWTAIRDAIRVIESDAPSATEPAAPPVN